MEEGLEGYLNNLAGYADPVEWLDMSAVFIILMNFIWGRLHLKELIVENNLYKNQVKNDQRIKNKQSTNQKQL